jgi:hypothetical protein
VRGKATRPNAASSFRAERAHSARGVEEDVIPSGGPSGPESRNRDRPDRGVAPLPGTLRFLDSARAPRELRSE